MKSQEYISAVVVLYNKHCEDSPTCKALKKIDDQGIQPIIYDNSTSDMKNAEYCEAAGWVYLGGKGNDGISKAYNACVDYLKVKNTTGLVCFFDDDTDIDLEYFEKLRTATVSGEKIYVPLIFSNRRLISPCLLNTNHKVSGFKDAKQALNYNGNELSAINSCMAIQLSVFNNYRYDENIFLDGVDHFFALQMRERGIKLKVFDYCCNHAFSGTERPPKAVAKVRFRIYAKDYQYILKHNKLAYIKLVGKRALSLCLKYKTLEFLFMR